MGIRMKDKIIRLLKAIGIALLCFGGLYLFIWGVIKYGKIASLVGMVLLFIFVVWRIYKDADFL